MSARETLHDYYRDTRPALPTYIILGLYSVILKLGGVLTVSWFLVLLPFVLEALTAAIVLAIGVVRASRTAA